MPDVKEIVIDEVRNGISYINSEINSVESKKKRYYMQGRLNAYEEVMDLYNKGLDEIEIGEIIIERAESKTERFENSNSFKVKEILYGEIKAYIFVIEFMSNLHKKDYDFNGLEDIDEPVEG